MGNKPDRPKPNFRKQLLRFFVSVAVATGIYWLYLGPAKTRGEFYFRVALTGGAFVGAFVTVMLKRRSEK